MGVANEVSAGVGIPKGGEAAKKAGFAGFLLIHCSFFLFASRQTDDDGGGDHEYHRNGDKRDGHGVYIEIASACLFDLRYQIDVLYLRFLRGVKRYRRGKRMKRQKRDQEQYAQNFFHISFYRRLR